MSRREVRTNTATQLSRAQILSTTSDCLHQFGYDATTIRRIASQLDCSVGSIYRYFRDKRELLYAVTQQTLEPVADAAEAGLTVEKGERLYRQLVDNAPQIYRLMFWLACVDNDDGIHDHLPTVVDRIIKGWSALLGDIESAQTRWAALHADIMITGYRAMIVRVAPSPVDEQSRRQALLSMLSPLPRQPASDHALETEQQPGPIPEQTRSDEDVCLL